MNRDAYAKEVINAAETAFRRNETASCPHESCDERLSVVRQNTFSTRSLFCPVHGWIFQEQEAELFGKLEWDGASEKCEEEFSGLDMDEQEDEGYDI